MRRLCRTALLHALLLQLVLAVAFAHGARKRAPSSRAKRAAQTCAKAWASAKAYDAPGAAEALAWLRLQRPPPECLARLGERALALAQEADEAMTANELPAAAAHFMTVHALTPTDPAILAKLITALQWAGRADEARQFADSAVGAGVGLLLSQQSIRLEV